MTSNTEAQESSIPTPGLQNTTSPNNAARPALIGVSILAVVALAAAVWFGIGWGQALFVDKAVADTRDSALAGAQQVAINLNTVDAANIDQSFENMKSSITGDTMLNDLESTQSTITDEVRNSGAKSTAELMYGTLTELSADENTATALVVIATTTTWPDRPEDKSKLTLRLFMEEVDGTWKANKVDPVGNRISLNADPAAEAADPNTVDPNAVDPNAVDPNAVDPNAVDPNAVDPNAVDPNAVDPSAVPPAAEDPAAVPGTTGGP